MRNALFSPSPAQAATFGIPTDECIGLGNGAPHFVEPQLRRYINLKLAAMGLPHVKETAESELEGMTRLLLARQQQSYRLLADYLCPADQRIQNFLYDYLQENPVTKLPARTSCLIVTGWLACCRSRPARTISPRRSLIPTA